MSGIAQATRGSVPAAGGVVVDARGHVLLVRRGRPPELGRWSLPGGRVEAGESPDTAVLREVREETGLATAIVHFIEEVILEKEGTVFRIHEYLLVPLDDVAARAGDDAAEVRWVSPGDLASLGVSPEVASVIERGLCLLVAERAGR